MLFLAFNETEKSDIGTALELPCTDSKELINCIQACYIVKFICLIQFFLTNSLVTAQTTAQLYKLHYSVHLQNESRSYFTFTVLLHSLKQICVIYIYIYYLCSDCCTVAQTRKTVLTYTHIAIAKLH